MLHTVPSHRRHSAPSDGETRLDCLLVRTIDGSQAVVALRDVAAIEELDAAGIVGTNGHFLARLGGRPVPLLDVSADLRRKTVLVFRDGARQVGLVVAAIIDIVRRDAAGAAALRRIEPAALFVQAYAGLDLSAHLARPSVAARLRRFLRPFAGPRGAALTGSPR